MKDIGIFPGLIGELQQELLNGRTSFKGKDGDIRVDTQKGGYGGRYQSFITTPTYNTLVETPATVDVEGITSFTLRLATKLLDMGVRPDRPKVRRKKKRHRVD